MSFPADLRTKLLAAITGTVGTRVYWAYRPQASALPAVVLHSINEPLVQHMEGPIATQGNYVQADCIAKTKLEAWALREAVTAALISDGTHGSTEFQGGLVQLRRAVTEDTPDGVVHTEQVGVIVWFN